MAPNIGIIYQRKTAPELKMVKLAAMQIKALLCTLSLLMCSWLSGTVNAQSLLKDSVMNAAMLGVNYTYQIPFGVMADRFGPNSAIGGGVSFKVKHNIILGVDGAYMFNRDVNEIELFVDITLNGATAIGRDGGLEDIQISQRGFQIKGNIGKIIPFKRPNKNSGLLVMLGLGVIQHRIFIKVEKGNVLQLNDDYQKGYDRLTAGFLAAPFLGYQYMSNNRRLNFYAGLELALGFTQGLRTWQFDTNSSGQERRTDILLGLKAGWILPIYFKPTEKYYYY